MTKKKQVLRVRNVCITDFTTKIKKSRNGDKVLNTPSILYTAFPGKISYIQRSPLELAPETKKPHYHWYVEFSDKVSVEFIKRELFQDEKIHIEPRYGTQQQAINYCTGAHFSKTRKQFKHMYTLANPTDQPLICGYPKAPGRRKDWVRVNDAIKRGCTATEIFEEFPMKSVVYRKHILFAVAQERHTRFQGEEIERTVIVRTGNAGTGKDHSVYEEYGAENVYELCRDENGSVWWDGYEGQDVLLISDFKWWLTRARLLNITGNRMVRVSYKGGTEWFTGTTVVITSNYRVENWYPDTEGIGWKGKGKVDPAFASRVDEHEHWEYEDLAQDEVSMPKAKVIKKPNYRKRAKLIAALKRNKKKEKKKRKSGVSITPRPLGEETVSQKAAVLEPESLPQAEEEPPTSSILFNLFGYSS